MKTIPLTQGYFTQVDDEDYEKFASIRWYASNDGRGGIRPVRDKIENGKKIHIYLSREILNAPKGRKVDHINGDTLDNRKINLRLCSHKENLRNQKINSKNTSGFKGVNLDKRDGRWYASIMVNKKHISLGGFFDRKDAARAYNEAAQKYFGEFARLNIL